VAKTLQQETLLGGYSARFADSTLVEATELSILSVASPLGGMDALSNTLSAQHGINWPNTGLFVRSDKSNSAWLGLQQDQCFALFEALEAGRLNKINTALQSQAYTTDQSDSWVCLDVAGSLARSALERICPIDLHPSVFPEGSVTRTSMEHLAVIIMCSGENSYRLLSPSSSAQSFLHAMETSFHNIA